MLLLESILNDISVPNKTVRLKVITYVICNLGYLHREHGILNAKFGLEMSFGTFPASMTSYVGKCNMTVKDSRGRTQMNYSLYIYQLYIQTLQF